MGKIFRGSNGTLPSKPDLSTPTPDVNLTYSQDIYSFL